MLSARLPLVIFVPCMLPIKIPGWWEIRPVSFWGAIRNEAQHGASREACTRTTTEGLPKS
jgi:hypothetical protein